MSIADEGRTATGDKRVPLRSWTMYCLRAAAARAAEAGEAPEEPSFGGHPGAE